MGCKQSTLRTETPVAAAAAPKPASVSVAPVLAAEEVTVIKATSASPRAVEEPTPAVDDVLAEIFANQEQVATAASPRAESVKAASPMRLGTRAPSTLNVATAASPKKEEVAPAMEDKPAAAISFSEFLAQQENTVATTTASKGQKSDSKPRKVLFDAETMRKSAPKNQTHNSVPSTKLTKKQQEMVKKQHVSVGRRGPVASRFEKGSKSQMQTDVYLQMASAFERLLTNADTINAHLDTR